MKSLSPALQAHLDEGTTTLAWCWRIMRADGVTFGFTDHDRTLSFDGTDFEPEEENPMLGWRGASRYYDPDYRPGFALAGSIGSVNRTKIPFVCARHSTGRCAFAPV